MMQFEVNSGRFDPYKKFKFLVKWNGRTVLGVSTLRAFTKATTKWSALIVGKENQDTLSN